MNGRTVVLVGLASLALAVMVLGALAGLADAQGLPEIQIRMDPEHQEQIGRPTATENDLLLFPGEVTVSKNIWLEPAELEMRMEMSGSVEPWTYSFDPPTLTFQASSTKHFNVTVTVPSGLSFPGYYTLVFNATPVSGFPSPPFSTITPGTGRVSIAQYYAIGRQFSTVPLEVTQGDITPFNITLVNRGNGDDTFVLEVANDAELLFAGLEVFFERSHRVGEGDEKQVDLRVQARDDAREGSFQINLTITSEGSSSDPEYDEPVTNGAEWTVVVEPSLVNTAFSNWYYIVGAVVVVVALALVLNLVRKSRAKGEGEPPGEGDPNGGEDDDVD